MKTKLLSILALVLVLSISAAQANEQIYNFEGEDITDGTFRAMCDGFFYGQVVTWNGSPITLDEAKAIYYESHPDALPKYNVVKHVGHSTVTSHGKSSAPAIDGTPDEESNPMKIVNNHRTYIDAVQNTDDGVVVKKNTCSFIHVINDGDGDVKVVKNRNSHIHIDNLGSGQVIQRGNVGCVIRIRQGNVFVLS